VLSWVRSRALPFVTTMPFRKISRDVKITAIRLYDLGYLPLYDILDCVGFSRRTFYRILKRWQETGDVVRHTFGLPGRPRNLHFDDILYLLRLVRHRPDWFLDELQDLLRHNRFISVHYATIHRELERCGVSVKKLKRVAKERNENLRADFIRQMAQYDPEQIGFIDETSKDERTTQRRRGRAKKGRRAEMKGVFVPGRGFSVEALLTLDGLSAGKVVEGSMTRVSFLEWLEYDVVCIPLLVLYFLTCRAQEFHSCRNVPHFRVLSVC